MKSKLTRVVYRETFPKAPYGINVHIELECKVDPKETYEQALDGLKNMVQGWYQKNGATVIMSEEIPYVNNSVPVKQNNDGNIPGSREIRTIGPSKAQIEENETTEKFNALKKTLEEIKDYDPALNLLNNSEFKHNMDLKKIIVSKKSTN
jgi:hypothetical protein